MHSNERTEATVTPITRVRGVDASTNPIAYQLGLWEVVAPTGERGAERVYGPDTLPACLQAQRMIEPVLAGV